MSGPTRPAEAPQKGEGSKTRRSENAPAPAAAKPQSQEVQKGGGKQIDASKLDKMKIAGLHEMAKEMKLEGVAGLLGAEG